MDAFFGKGSSQKLMGSASQEAARQARAQPVPGAREGFQFFPTQVGGATPWALSMRPYFVGICIYQALMAVVALIEFANFLSGIIMIVGVLVAFGAFTNHMNITYICWWGVISLAGFVAGVVGALIGFAVMLSTIIVKFNIPLSCFFGMGMAWFLYKDYEQNTPGCTDTVGSWLRALGLLQPAPVVPAPNSLGALEQSILPNFGAWGADADAQKQALAGKADAYGTMGKDYATQAQGQMSNYGGQAQGQMSNYGGQAQAEADKAQGFVSNLFGSTSQLAQGRHDTKRDPFMTL